MRDFSIEMYRRLLEELKNRDVYTMRDFLLKRPSEGIILRHDVDVCAKKALRMAKIEKECELHSTYYFRYPKTFDPDVMIEINDLGHEIGYHYEVIDKTRGNLEEAIKLFSYELEEFRKIVPIHTCSMHGGVLTNFDNRDFWKSRIFEDYDLLGEAYLSIDYKKVHYFTDTGMNWGGRFSIKDEVSSPSPFTKNLKSTNELIELFSQKKIELACITTHPKRWNKNSGEWFKEYISQSIKNIGKKFVMRLRHV